MNKLALGGFDYSALPPAVAKDAQRVAQKVREAHARTIQTILGMGRELLTVKAQLEHGQFGKWLEAEFGGVARTAQNYMIAAERFADKSETISYLPPTTVYRLAAPSTPERVREAVIERIEAGDRPAPDEVTYLVAEARREDRRAREQAAAKEARKPEVKAAREAAAQRRHERGEREAEKRREARREASASLGEILTARLQPAEMAWVRANLKVLEPFGGPITDAVANEGDDAPVIATA